MKSINDVKERLRCLTEQIGGIDYSINQLEIIKKSIEKELSLYKEIEFNYRIIVRAKDKIESKLLNKGILDISDSYNFFQENRIKSEIICNCGYYKEDSRPYESLIWNCYDELLKILKEDYKKQIDIYPNNKFKLLASDMILLRVIEDEVDHDRKESDTHQLVTNKDYIELPIEEVKKYTEEQSIDLYNKTILR